MPIAAKSYQYYKKRDRCFVDVTGLVGFRHEGINVQVESVTLFNYSFSKIIRVIRGFFFCDIHIYVFCVFFFRGA